MNLFTKQKWTHRSQNQIDGYQKGNVGGAGGVITQEIGVDTYTTTVYKIDKQQGPSVQHRELYAIFLITYNEKESEKEQIYTCMYN